MTEPGIVIHRFGAAHDAKPIIREPADQISGTRLYKLEGAEHASRCWLAWYETTARISSDDTGNWTTAANGLEAMSFDLRCDVASPDQSVSQIRFLYVVHTDVPDDVAEEYNAWYDEEHLPRLVRVPGIVRARRYVSPDQHPRYLTAYDLVDHDAFTSPEGLKARKTAWTERMRGLFTNTRRFTAQLISVN